MAECFKVKDQNNSQLQLHTDECCGHLCVIVVWTHVFISLGLETRSGFAGSCGQCMFDIKIHFILVVKIHIVSNLEEKVSGKNLIVHQRVSAQTKCGISTYWNITWQ